jgi:hypothetical protein
MDQFSWGNPSGPFARTNDQQGRHTYTAGGAAAIRRLGRARSALVERRQYCFDAEGFPAHIGLLPDRRIERDNEVSGAASMVKPLKKNTATAPGWIFVKASDRRLQRLLVEILEDIDFKAGFLQLISNSTRVSERGGQR